MPDPINLRQARKARARAAAETQAAANRALHGRTKTQKQADAAQAARWKRELDGARLKAGALNDDDEDARCNREMDGSRLGTSSV